MARYDDRQRVGEQYGENLTIGIGLARGLRYMAIGSSSAVGDLGGLSQDSTSESGELGRSEIVFQVEATSRAGEVLGEPPKDFIQEIRSL